MSDYNQQNTMDVITYPWHKSINSDTPGHNINWLWPSDAIWGHIWVNIGSGIGLLPDGTKPLPKPMLTYHQ